MKKNLLVTAFWCSLAVIVAYLLVGNTTVAKKATTKSTVASTSENSNEEPVVTTQLWVTSCVAPVYDRTGERVAMLPMNTVVAVVNATSDMKFAKVRWDYHGAIFSGWVFTAHIKPL